MIFRLLSKFSSFSSLNQTNPALGYIQIATYLAPPLPKDIQKQFDEHRHVHLTPENDIGCQKNYSMEKLFNKEQKWARYGSRTGINPADLFLSQKEISEEREAEIRWWMTLQKMQHDIEEKQKEELHTKQEREQKIGENMKKMPGWVEKFEAEHRDVAEQRQLMEEKRKMEEEQAREKIGYNVPSGHPVLQEYLSKQKEILKKEKKRLKRER